MDHEIFRSPHAVELTLEERPMPVEYQLRTAEDLGETLAMWRVQTEGYTEGTDQLIGLVSQGKQYEDSPDAEWIAGGVNTKAIDAVALGRHGNWFHWGFAASPTYMTDEAKLVLVNALHYIARFDGQAPLVRVQRGVVTRSSLGAALDEVGEEGYARKVARYENMAAADEAAKQEIRDRIAAGEEVSDDDRRFASFPPPSPPDRMRSLQRLVAEQDWPDVGDDPEAIRAALVADLPYVRYAGTWYQLEIDRELRELGIANHDPALLDWAVDALTTEADADLARTLLERYTDEAFATDADWIAWYGVHREHLFFTEPGGYLWVSALRDPAAETAAEPGRAATGASAPVEPDEPSRAQPLTAALSATTIDPTTVRVVVAVRILRGWHAYDRVPKGLPYTALAPTLELPDGDELEVTWQRPSALPDRANPRMTVFEGDLEFVAEVPVEQLAGATELVCRLRSQVCDQDLCMPPSTERLTTPLPPVPAPVEPPTEGSAQPR